RRLRSTWASWSSSPVTTGRSPATSSWTSIAGHSARSWSITAARMRWIKTGEQVGPGRQVELGLPLQQELRAAVDRRDRRSQLVRQNPDEPVADLVGLLAPGRVRHDGHGRRTAVDIELAQRHLDGQRRPVAAGGGGLEPADLARRDPGEPAVLGGELEQVGQVS